MATKKTGSSRSKLPKSFNDRPFYGLTLDDEQIAFANAVINPDIDIVFVNAKAGTGKTTIATGLANILVQCGAYDNIVYIMSPYGERKQGWLPGTITEKSSVYFEAFYQACVACDINPNTDIINENPISQKVGTGYITCITDTFLRGSNLDNSVIIIDEAQNYTVPQLKKTLTRVGKNVKVIVIGHNLQCDLDRPELSGFVRYIEHFRGKERCAICTLSTNHRSWISQWADELPEMPTFNLRDLDTIRYTDRPSEPSEYKVTVGDYPPAPSPISFAQDEFGDTVITNSIDSVRTVTFTSTGEVECEEINDTD